MNPVTNSKVAKIARHGEALNYLIHVFCSLYYIIVSQYLEHIQKNGTYG